MLSLCASRLAEHLIFFSRWQHMTRQVRTAWPQILCRCRGRFTRSNFADAISRPELTCMKWLTAFWSPGNAFSSTNLSDDGRPIVSYYRTQITEATSGLWMRMRLAFLKFIHNKVCNLCLAPRSAHSFTTSSSKHSIHRFPWGSLIWKLLDECRPCRQGRCYQNSEGFGRTCPVKSKNNPTQQVSNASTQFYWTIC